MTDAWINGQYIGKLIAFRLSQVTDSDQRLAEWQIPPEGSYAAEVEKLQVAMDNLTYQVALELMPIALDLVRETQRVYVDFLNASPWWRYWRGRWSLRKAPKWSE